MKFGLAIALIFVLAACDNRRGDIVYLPSHYRGWVTIEYNVKGAPALGYLRGKNLIRVPPLGLVQTSSGRKVGYASDEYWFESQDGYELRVPEELTVREEGLCEKQTCVLRPIYQSVPTPKTFFYVGSKSQMEQSTPPDRM